MQPLSSTLLRARLPNRGTNLLFQIYELRNIHEDTRCRGRTQALNPKESKGAKPSAHYHKGVLKKGEGPRDPVHVHRHRCPF